MNIMRWLILMSAVLLLAGCSQAAKKIDYMMGEVKNRPMTFEQAVEFQQKESEMAVVLATYDESMDAGGKGVIKRLFLEKQTATPVIVFAGSPYHIKSKKLQQLHDFSKKSGDMSNAKSIALGGFSITKHKNWAYVAPAKYAIHKVQSRNGSVADMRGWGRNDGKAYMVFDVNPGDIIYLGHITGQRLDNGAIAFTVEDRFNELLKNSPEIADYTVRKQIVRVPSMLRPDATY